MPEREKAHTEVIVDKLPECEFCRMRGIRKQAEYDGRTLYSTWAYMCREHFREYGTGLGLGRGQGLILKKEVKICQREE